MASREAEKEARRKARLEQEAAERAAEGRRKRLQIVLAGILAVGVVVAAVILIANGGSGHKAADDNVSEASANGVKLPTQQISDVDEAADAAGCKLTHPPDEGRGHADKTFTASDYGTNPPTSGVHFPQWAQDGVYTPENTPPLGQLVHTLEHGRINLQYKPGTDKQTVAKLEALVAEKPYHMLLYQNPTGMKLSLIHI